MTDRTNSDMEGQITSDRETIREWAAEIDATPVRSSGEGGREEYRLAPEAERRSADEELSWDAFFEAMEQDDRVVVARDAGETFSLDVIEHDRAVSQSALASEELQEALLEGETITTEVTETTVIEETIVEHADVESKVVDRTPVSDEFLGAELVSRDVQDCKVIDVEGESTVTDTDYFDTGYRTDVDEVQVDVRVDEQWSATRELLEQVTIESRVVDTDIEESASVEADAIETRIELGDVERTILESGILDSHDVDTSAIDRSAVRSEFTENDTVVTELLERKTIEEEMRVNRLFTGTLVDAETTAVETGSRTVVESELAEGDEFETGAVDVEAVQGTTDDATAVEGTASVRAPEDSDQGKTVVNDQGEEIGIVADVRAGTMYVDPHPSITDRIRARLDWGDMDEESYPLDNDEIAEITRSEVRLRSER